MRHCMGVYVLLRMGARLYLSILCVCLPVFCL